MKEVLDGVGDGGIVMAGGNTLILVAGLSDSTSSFIGDTRPIFPDFFFLKNQAKNFKQNTITKCTKNRTTIGKSSPKHTLCKQ